MSLAGLAWNTKQPETIESLSDRLGHYIVDFSTLSCENQQLKAEIEQLKTALVEEKAIVLASDKLQIAIDRVRQIADYPYTHVADKRYMLRVCRAAERR